jgi:phage head maturation protease
MAEELLTTELPTEIEIRDLAKREIDIRIVPWDTVVDTPNGLEEFKRGAFDGIDAGNVVLRMDHQNPPAGRGLNLEQRDDAAYMTFRVSKTQRGDEILTLAADGVARGASIGFMQVPGGTAVEYRSGRRVNVHRKSGLKEVSTTWLPTYERAAVLATRSTEGEGQMAETQEAPAPVEAPPAPVITNVVDLDPVMQAISKRFGQFEDSFGDRLQRIEERGRQDITIPARQDVQHELHKGLWFHTAMRILSGERVSNQELQTRELADLITSDNAGVVPDAFSQELIGIIDPSRPFLESTRRLPTPDSGMSLIVPRIVTRPTVGIQSAEKDDLTSTPTSITSATFNAVTKGGAGDISLQLLRRSSPSYLSLYLELLAEAYAIDSDDEAVDALLAENDVVEGGSLDPDDANFGSAWSNAMAVSRRLAPDRIWLSSTAVAQFIDAKANGTNAPLYSNLEANFTAAGGTGGTISGLRPVHVPALDDESVDIIVGPSRGFAWAEDGTFTLQVDVPAKAGRDVALVGILWFAPLYPAAFTSYTLSS